MRKLFKVIAVLFFLFILWIVYSADTGKTNIFFEITNAMPYGDKVGHFFLFGLLTLLLNLALNLKPFIRGQNLPLGTVLVSVFVILEELSQYFFANRTLDIMDLIADGLGILIFTFLSYVLYTKRTSNIEKSVKK